MADQGDTGETNAPDGASSVPTERENLAPLQEKPLPAGRQGLTPPPPKSAGNISADIANILKEVKLPQRQTPQAAPKKTIENKAAAFDLPAQAGTVPSGQAFGAPQTAAPQANVAAAPAPQPPVPPAPSPTPPQSKPAEAQKQPEGPVVAMHTLKDDLQHVVRDEKISVVRAVSLEEDRRAREKGGGFAPPEPPKKHIGVIFASILLVALGAAALLGVYAAMNARKAPPAQVASSSLLFAESSVSFPIDGQTPDDLKRKLASARSGLQATLGSITAVVPTVSVQQVDGTTAARAATFAEFMQAMGAHPPEALLRALDDRFFFGLHVVDTNAPILIVPVLSYDRAFAGMLAWEGTMNADLSPLFTALPRTKVDQSGLPVDRTFVDDVMRNYDVRELKDDAGQVKLYYAIPSQGILVIAESPYSFQEILSRLQASRQL